MFREISSKKSFKVILTSHAIGRMKERGFDPTRIIKQLKKLGETHLLRNSLGYEVVLPFTGRLAGDIENNAFIVKTFLLPIYNLKDYNTSVKKTSRSMLITVEKVLLPKSILDKS